MITRTLRFREWAGALRLMYVASKYSGVPRLIGIINIVPTLLILKLVHPAGLVAAEENGTIVGFLAWHGALRPYMAEIAYIAVDPGHRCRGVGGALLAEAYSRMKARGYRTAAIMIKSTNGAALGLLKREGYTPRGGFTVMAREVGV